VIANPTVFKNDQDGYYVTVLPTDAVKVAELNDLRSRREVEGQLQKSPVNVTEIASTRPDEEDIVVTYFDDTAASEIPTYKHVALGGSFDHMHNGHRKLLYLAVCVSEEELTVGVTADSMLSAKANAHLIDSFSIRAKRVENFVRKLNPNLKYNIVVCWENLYFMFVGSYFKVHVGNY
jgi:bifunctional ADP-heptose synthase (sugar kinase/adenylyltransferase)